MATQPVDDEQPLEIEAEEPEEQEQPDEVNDEGDEPDFVIEGEEDEPEQETPVIKRLRERERQLSRELAEARKAAPPRQVEVGEEPTLEGCDWDDQKFKEQYRGWVERRHQADNVQRDQQRAQEEQARKLKDEEQAFRAKAAKLPVRDFDQAYEVVQAGIPDIMRQAIYRYMPDKAAETVYWLGKNPSKVDQIAGEEDPVAQLLMLDRIAQKVQMKPKVKKPPEPETIVRGSGQISTPNADKQRAKLEEEAARTGDRTKIIAYNRAQKLKEKK